ECLLIYSNSCKLKGIRIPVSGLLEESDVRIDWEVPDTSGEIPVYFKTDNSETDVPFDILAASFYIVTEYEKYSKQVLDKHGRYLEVAYPSFEKGVHNLPVVQDYAELLWSKLTAMHPDLQREDNAFSWEVGIDVDQPWAFLNKGWRGLAGGINDLIRTDFENLKNRFRSWIKKEDPYHTFADINALLPGKSLIYFFLLNHDSKYDSFFTYKSKAYKQLITQLRESSPRLGIHPSYTSFLSKQAIKTEKSILEEISRKKVNFGRQHYLRNRLPKTRQIYLESGIFHDYNGCMIHACGFRNGMAIAFPWFDLSANEMTNLLVHPVMAMDVSLKDYMQLTPQEALSRLRDMIDITRKYKGTFNLLWHNSSLSEIHGWQGWKDVFIEVVSELKRDT
ncbi:polysaccharide deacetylase family protein, partial [Bacteroidota bacterium]